MVSGGSDRLAKVWSPSEGIIREFAAHKGNVNSVSVVPGSSGSRFLTGGFDGIAVLWDAVSGDVIGKLEGHPLGVEVLCLDSETFVTCSGDKNSGIVRIWKNGVCVKHLPRAHESLCFVLLCFV
jgi:WD40 repeat protein